MRISCISIISISIFLLRILVVLNYINKNTKYISLIYSKTKTKTTIKIITLNLPYTERTKQNKKIYVAHHSYFFISRNNCLNFISFYFSRVDYVENEKTLYIKTEGLNADKIVMTLSPGKSVNMISQQSNRILAQASFAVVQATQSFTSNVTSEQVAHVIRENDKLKADLENLNQGRIIFEAEARNLGTRAQAFRNCQSTDE